MKHLAALGLVGLAAGVTIAIGAEDEAPGRLLILAVLAAALLGRGPGMTGAAASVVAYLALEQRAGQLDQVTEADPLLGLVTYVLAAVLVAVLVSRTTDLRRAAERGQREAQLRYEQSQRLMAEREALDTRAREASLEADMSRTRAAFFAAAGHNLRTPLAAVQAAVSTLLSPGAQLTPDERVEMLETIRDETERLSRLVTKVLEMSRIRSDRVVPHPEPVDLEALVQAAVHRLGQFGSAHRFELDLAALDGSELWLDEIMAEQILLNTLENAVRFAPPDTAIEVSAAQRGDGMVELRIADHGPGVPAPERSRVFDEFHRGTRAVESEGTGLGLAIVRALTEAHGGTIVCEETPGGGATFVFAFPATRAPVRSRTPV